MKGVEDYRVRVGWRGHWKRELVHATCGADGVLAVSDLWEFCAQNKPDGDLSGMTDRQIAAAAGYRGDYGAWVDALCEAVLLEGEPGDRRVHDWRDHQPYAASAPARSKGAKAANHAKMVQKKRPHLWGEWCAESGCADLGLAEPPDDQSRSASRDAHETAQSGVRNAPEERMSVSPRSHTQITDPDHIPTTSGVRDAGANDTPRATLGDLTEALNNAKLPAILGGSHRELFNSLRPTHEEISHAVSVAVSRNLKPPPRPEYVLGIIRKDRERAAEIRTSPRPPDAPPRPKSRTVYLTEAELTGEKPT
jgi:hypothetical protein